MKISVLDKIIQEKIKLFKTYKTKTKFKINLKLKYKSTKIQKIEKNYKIPCQVFLQIINQNSISK